jgi:predicted RNA-binding Zn ribbon-like protein
MGLVSQLTLDAQEMRLYRPTIDAAMAMLARDSVRLFGDARLRERIHRCENSGCRVIFYDDSKPGLRRWCAPNRCGDRMRARFYWERHQKRGS